MTLNVFDENPFKDIYLILFRAFLPKFITFGRGSVSEVYLRKHHVLLDFRNIPLFSVWVWCGVRVLQKH